MTRKITLPGIVFLTFFLGASAFDKSVHILLNHRQQVTSSTLNWLPISHFEASKDIVVGGFEVQRQPRGHGENQTENAVVKDRSIYVCSVNHNGVLVAGKQIDGEKRCTVTYLGNVASYERYDLLENVDNSARTSWSTWNKFHQPPVGAVAVESRYVARHVVTKNESLGANGLTYTHYIGTYDSSEGLGKITYVKDDGKEGTADSGEILVETEPVFYELNAVKLNHHKKRIIKRIPKILRETTISNTRSEPADLGEALGYNFNYTIYWGQGQAMIKALNTSITKIEGTKLGYVSWGIHEKSVRSNATNVKIHLAPGTAVNVTLRANYTDMEIPYTADLVSLYADGERRSRVVSGKCSEETMMDVKLELSEIYFLSNWSLVPTTLPPPSTEAITTTTTTVTTTITAKQPEYTSKDLEEGSTEIDENLIVRPRDSDAANIQNDDGGPLSLKDKVSGSQSASGLASLGYKPSLAVISICAIAFYRIT